MCRNVSMATALALALGLAACETRQSGAAGEGGTMTGGADAGAAADSAGQASRITEQQEGVGERIALELRPLNESGISGEVNLTPTENQTTVIVTLEGTEAQARHMAHVHTGTCENIGSPVAPLEPIGGAAAQGPTSTTLIDMDAATLTDGNHVVVAHEAGGSPGRPVVCAPIRSGGSGAQG